MIGIYKFTNNITGQSYVGQSSNIERRYKEHKCRGVKHEDSYFHQMLHKYGFENFSFEVLEECSLAQLSDLETKYIKLLGTRYPNGYNLTSGGSDPHLNKLVSFEDIEKIISLLRDTAYTNGEIGALFNISDQMVSDINCGRAWCSDTYSYPIRKRNTPVTNKPHCVQDTALNDNGVKIFVARPIRACEKCGKRIDNDNISGLCATCYQAQLTNASLKSRLSKEELKRLLMEHSSFSAVARMFDVSATLIKKLCIQYELPYHIGYYKKPKPPRVKDPNRHNHKIAVAMVDKESGQKLRFFNSCGDAAQHLIEQGLTKCKFDTIRTHISEVCRGKRKSAAGFAWQSVAA